MLLLPRGSNPKQNYPVNHMDVLSSLVNPEQSKRNKTD